MTKTICVRNDVDRVYNGIQYGQIIKIDEDRLEYYTDLWFVQVENPNPSEDSSEGDNGMANDGSDESADIAARKLFLKEHGINVAKNRTEATIIAKSNELGYEEENAE